MAGKRFPGSMFGFNKSAVNVYLETMTKDYEEKLAAKDFELEKTTKQLRKITDRYEELKLAEEMIRSEKEKITGALIQANEKANQILDDARNKAANEVNDLEEAAEKEREKIVDVRKQLMKMKADATSVLSNYSKAINEMIFDEEVPEPIEEKVYQAEENDVAYDAAAKATEAKETDDYFA